MISPRRNRPNPSRYFVNLAVPTRPRPGGRRRRPSDAMSEFARSETTDPAAARRHRTAGQPHLHERATVTAPDCQCARSDGSASGPRPERGADTSLAKSARRPGGSVARARTSIGGCPQIASCNCVTQCLRTPGSGSSTPVRWGAFAQGSPSGRRDLRPRRTSGATDRSGSPSSGRL